MAEIRNDKIIFKSLSPKIELIRMDKTVYEFTSGKNNWLETEVRIENNEIVIKNEVGRLAVEPDSVSDLITGLEEAKRELDREMD